MSEEKMRKCGCGCGKLVPEGQRYFIEEDGAKHHPKRKKAEEGPWKGAEAADTSKAKPGAIIDQAAASIPAPRKFDPDRDLRTPLGRTNDTPRAHIRNRLRIDPKLLPHLKDGRPIGTFWSLQEDVMENTTLGYRALTRDDLNCDAMPVDPHPQGHEFSGTGPIRQGELVLMGIHPDLQKEYQDEGHRIQVKKLEQIRHPEEHGVPGSKDFRKDTGSTGPIPTAVHKEESMRRGDLIAAMQEE